MEVSASREMPQNPEDPRSRLLESVEAYTDSEDPRDLVFINHIREMAAHPKGLHRYRAAASEFLKFTQKLPYKIERGAIKRKDGTATGYDFGGGPNAQQFKQEMDRLLNDALIVAFNKLFSEFNPTSKSLTGCFIKWVKEKCRLKYMMIDWYRKEFGTPKALTEKQQARLIKKYQKEERERSREEAHELLTKDMDDQSNNFFWLKHLMDDSRCTYRVLAENVLLGDGALQEITNRFGFDYDAFYAEYKRHFCPAIICHRLENSLFTPQDLDRIQMAIEQDRSLDNYVYNHLPLITPKFMAERRFRMFGNSPRTFDRIVEELKKCKPKTYGKLTPADLETMYRKKIVPILGKLVARVLNYKGTNILTK